jgi:hypothetical protein
MSFRTAMSRHPPIVHKDDHTIRGPMFCSFLAPVLRKEREDRLAAAGYILEWADIVHDLERLIRNRGRARQLAWRNTAPTVPHRPAHARVALPPLVRCAQPPARHNAKKQPARRGRKSAQVSSLTERDIFRLLSRYSG